MNPQPTDATDPGQADTSASARLSWPPRAQRLVDTIRALCTDWLHEPLRRCLTDFDTVLRQHTADAADATHTRNARSHQAVSTEQRKLFDSNFIARIHKAFDELGMESARSAPEPKPGRPLALALLETVEHDLDGALAQLIARSETRHGPVLLELGYRMALLIGAPPLPSAAVPIGPQALADAFRQASRALDLPAPHELLLAHSLERSLMQGMQPLYELVNDHLRSDGILPNLQPFGSPQPLLSPQEGTVPIEPYSAPAKPRTPVAHPTAVDLDGNILDLQTRLDEHTATPTLRVASNAELHDALAALQRNFRELDPQLRHELRRAPMLKQELLDQLNIDHSFGADRVELSSRQLHALERSASLFEAIIVRLPSGNAMARALIEELQLPITRVALTDPTFFTQPDQAARRWLQEMVDGARYWLEPNEGQRTGHLGKLMLALIERAATDHPDAELYARLTAQLQRYLQPLQHVAAETERNHIQALLDFERRERVRVRADEVLSKRSANVSLNKAQHALLDEAWRDALALTILRHGENSEAFGIQLVITDQLLGRMPAGDRHKLQQGVELGLHQIGMTHSQAARLTHAALDTGAPQTTAATRTAARLRPRPVQPTAQTEDADASVSRIAPQHGDIHQRMLALPSGTWFQFVAQHNSPARRLKLAMCSPASGRTLFVDTRGQRAAQLTLAELAEAITSERARELPGNQDLFEKAWRTLAASVPESSENNEAPA